MSDHSLDVVIEHWLVRVVPAEPLASKRNEYGELEQFGDTISEHINKLTK